MGGITLFGEKLNHKGAQRRTKTKDNEQTHNKSTNPQIHKSTKLLTLQTFSK